MPVTEADVAITERLSSHNPFRAVLKQTVDDFIVNEISQQNAVLTLTTLPRSTPKRPRPVSPPPSEIPFSEIDQLFPSHDPPPSATLAAAISEAKSSHSFPVLKDKHSRTKLHHWVRQYLPSYIGDTLQTDDGQVIRIRLRSETKPWKRRRKDGSANEQDKQRAASDNTYDPREHHADYEHSFPRNSLVNFVLWKKNRDTTEALTMLGKALSRNVKHFAYAGTKDKRAVTTQLVQIRGVQERDLARANSKLLQRDRNRASVLVGNVSLAARNAKSSPLRLGDLKGNRFTLVLRDVEPHCDASIHTAVDSIRELGFINYFGLQRFGSGVSPTHVTGFAVLRGDFKEVCRRILLPLRIDEDDSKMHPARKRFVQALEQFGRDEITATQLLSQLAPWQRIERAMVESFASDEKRGVTVRDYKKAFGRLPRFLRMMYGHAVQSYLWNVMASERVRLSKPDLTSNRYAIEGDLVEETGERGDELSFKTKVRQVTKEEQENKSISVHRVLIPVLGSEVQLPSAPYTKKAQEIIEAEKLDFKEQARSEYQVKGTYRRLLAVPKDFESKFVSYSDKHDVVVPAKVGVLLAGLNEKKVTSPQANGTKNVDGESTKKEDIVSGVESVVSQGKVGVETMGGEDGSVTKSEASDKHDGVFLVHEVDNSKTSVRKNSKEDEADDNDGTTEEREEKVITSDVGQENAEIQKETREGVKVDPADVDFNKNGAAEQPSKEAAENGEGIKPAQKDGEACGDVQMEDEKKDQNCHQSKDTSEAKEAKELSASKDAAMETVTSVEEDGRQSEGSVENSDGLVQSPALAAAQEAFRSKETGDYVVEVVRVEERIASNKAAKKLEDKQSALVEDASHDKAEDASGHEVVPHGRPPTNEDGGNNDLDAADPSSSGSNREDSGIKSRRALIISFSLGCAEYATMLVRELTGHESSTAAQKALQGSV